MITVTDIYGTDSFGALIGGLVASAASLDVCLWLVVGLYGASFASALLNQLRTVEAILRCNHYLTRN